MKLTFIGLLLLAAPAVWAQDRDVEPNPVSAGHICSVTGIGSVYSDGLRLSAVVVELDHDVDGSTLEANDFSIDLTGNTLPASGVVTRVYTNTIASMAASGSIGRYVILEMSVDGWLPVSGETPETRAPERNGRPRPEGRNQPRPQTDFLKDVSLRGNPDAHPSIRLSNRHGGQGFTFAVRQERPLTAVDGSVLEPSGVFVDNEKDITLVLDDFAKPDFHNEQTGITSKFNLFVPFGYDPEKEYPLVVFLHDEYSCWNRHDEPLISGKGASIWAEPQMQARQEAFVLVPVFKRTCLTSMDMHELGLDETISLIQKVCTTFSIDASRMYLVGQGANAAAALLMMDACPSAFAAAACIGGAWTDARSFEALKGENLLFVATEGDTEGVNEVESCLEKLGGVSGNILYRKLAAEKVVPEDFEKNPLNCRVFTLRRAYEDGFVVEWLYRQRRTTD